VPALAALTSSSPSHEGVDTGFARFRTMWWSMWPISGVPPLPPSVAAYQRVAADLIAGGIIDDASTLYWDVRPSNRYPTLEFRAADNCTDIDDAVLHAGLVRSLVRTLARGLERDALRYRMRRSLRRGGSPRATGFGGLFDPVSGAFMPAALVIRRVVAQLEPDLREHGEFDSISRMVARVLNRGTSADLQRAQFAAGRDLRQVVQCLVRATRCWGSDAWPAA